MGEEIINLLKKGFRDKSNILQLTSLSLLFNLLEIFAKDKNNYAPIIYKILTFALIENHADLELREFLIKNFQNIFTSFYNIPIEILLEPLIKQIQVTENISYIINVFDIEFFNILASHPRLSVNNAIQLLDLFAKIYINNLKFSGNKKIK